jgi:hypothetical protein
MLKGEGGDSQLVTLTPCGEQHRKPPRKKSSARTLLSFQKREKKHCF